LRTFGIDIMAVVGLAVVMFASTNIDDVFVLLSFFADQTFRAHQIVVGQYLGIGVLVLGSIMASLISLVLAPAHVGLLGILPVLIGLKKLVDLQRAGSDAQMGKQGNAGLCNALSVAAVTIGNGGDNIGIYTPVFATRSMPEIALIILVFAAMVAVWLAFSHWLVNHPKLGAPIHLYGHIATPFILIGLGLFILYRAGSLSLLASLHARKGFTFD
jgi:cadmium resistance protein CadD (predicted permease)